MNITKKYLCEIDYDGSIEEVVIAIGSFDYDTATEAERNADEGIFYYCEDEDDFKSLQETQHCDGWKITKVIEEVDA